jgi:MYXO-CTERM domain-containing protein
MGLVDAGFIALVGLAGIAVIGRRRPRLINYLKLRN